MVMKVFRQISCWRWGALLPIVFWAKASLAEVAQKGAEKLGGAAEAAVDTSALVKMSLALIFVLALVIALSWLMKRSGLKGFGQAGPMALRGSLSLGGRERAVWVEVAGKHVLLGVAQGQVQYLCDLDAPPTDTAPPQMSFKNQLDQFLSKRKEPAGDE